MLTTKQKSYSNWNNKCLHLVTVSTSSPCRLAAFTTLSDVAEAPFGNLFLMITGSHWLSLIVTKLQDTYWFKSKVSYTLRGSHEEVDWLTCFVISREIWSSITMGGVPVSGKNLNTFLTKIKILLVKNQN